MIPEKVTRTRYVDGKKRTEQIHPVTCVLCGHTRWLKKWDAAKALRDESPCFRCSQSIKGKIAFAKNMLGTLRMRRKAWQIRQAWRLEHPSDLEMYTAGLLQRLNIPYMREVLFESTAGNFYLVDFIVYDAFAIEVQGQYWHDRPEQKRRDRSKKAFLTRRGYKTLRLQQQSIECGEAESLITKFLGGLEHGIRAVA